MALDINAFRTIASQNPDKLVYVQGESLKTTRNQAHHAAHAGTAAADGFYNRNPPEKNRFEGTFNLIPAANQINLDVGASFDILNA